MRSGVSPLRRRAVRIRGATLHVEQLPSCVVLHVLHQRLGQHSASWFSSRETIDATVDDEITAVRFLPPPPPSLIINPLTILFILFIYIYIFLSFPSRPPRRLATSPPLLPSSRLVSGSRASPSPVNGKTSETSHVFPRDSFFVASGIRVCSLCATFFPWSPVPPRVVEKVNVS